MLVVNQGCCEWTAAPPSTTPVIKPPAAFQHITRKLTTFCSAENFSILPFLTTSIKGHRKIYLSPHWMVSWLSLRKAELWDILVVWRMDVVLPCPSYETSIRNPPTIWKKKQRAKQTALYAASSQINLMGLICAYLLNLAMMQLATNKLDILTCQRWSGPYLWKLILLKSPIKSGTPGRSA